MDMLACSEQAYRLLNIIVLKQPMRTWCGGLLGMALVVINNIVSFMIYPDKSRQFYDDDWQLVILGVFALHLPTAWKLMVGKPQFDEDVEAALAILEKAREGGLAQARLNTAYHELCKKVINRVSQLQAPGAGPKKET
jgi:hypothetical protein